MSNFWSLVFDRLMVCAMKVNLLPSYTPCRKLFHSPMVLISLGLEVSFKEVVCGMCLRLLKQGTLSLSLRRLGQLIHPYLKRMSKCDPLLVCL